MWNSQHSQYFLQVLLKEVYKKEKKERKRERYEGRKGTAGF
jgi:hypothetical protein